MYNTSEVSLYFQDKLCTIRKQLRDKVLVGHWILIVQDLQRLSCKIRLCCKYIFQNFVGMYNELQIRTFTWSGTCKISEIRIKQPFKASS